MRFLLFFTISTFGFSFRVCQGLHRTDGPGRQSQKGSVRYNRVRDTGLTEVLGVENTLPHDNSASNLANCSAHLSDIAVNCSEVTKEVDGPAWAIGCTVVSDEV